MPNKEWGVDWYDADGHMHHEGGLPQYIQLEMEFQRLLRENNEDFVKSLKDIVGLATDLGFSGKDLVEWVYYKASLYEGSDQDF